MSDPLHYTPGERYGSLTILERAPNSAVVCRCDCGNLYTTKGLYLRDGRIKSCGCWRTKLTHAGETLPIAVWADRAGISYATLQYRLKQGWGIERAMTTPVRGRRYNHSQYL